MKLPVRQLVAVGAISALRQRPEPRPIGMLRACRHGANHAQFPCLEVHLVDYYVEKMPVMVVM
jgi:hypothetical protein